MYIRKRTHGVIIKLAGCVLERARSCLWSHHSEPLHTRSPSASSGARWMWNFAAHRTMDGKLWCLLVFTNCSSSTARKTDISKSLVWCRPSSLEPQNVEVVLKRRLVSSCLFVHLLSSHTQNYVDHGCRLPKKKKRAVVDLARRILSHWCNVSISSQLWNNSTLYISSLATAKFVESLRSNLLLL